LNIQKNNPTSTTRFTTLVLQIDVSPIRNR